MMKFIDFIDICKKAELIRVNGLDAKFDSASGSSLASFTVYLPGNRTMYSEPGEHEFSINITSQEFDNKESESINSFTFTKEDGGRFKFELFAAIML